MQEPGTNLIKPKFYINVRGQYNSRYGQVALLGNMTELTINSLTISGYGRCMLKKGPGMKINKLDMKFGSRLSGEESTVNVDDFEIIGGQVGPDLTLHIKNNMKFLESDQNIYIRSATVLIESPATIHRNTLTELSHSTLHFQGPTSIESNPLFGLLRNTPITESSVTFSGITRLTKSGAQVQIRTSAILTGTLHMNNGVFTTSYVTSNATINGNSGKFVTDRQNLESTFIGPGIWNVTNGMYEVREGITIFSSDYVLNVLHGYKGRLVVPAGVHVHFGELIILLQFTLAVEGRVTCDLLHLLGGRIEGDGHLVVTKLMWKSGVVAVGNAMTNETTGLVVEREAVVFSDGQQQITEAGVVTCLEGAKFILEKLAKLRLTGSNFINFGSVLMWHGTAINGDENSMFVHEGSLLVRSGVVQERTQIGIPKKITGTMSVMTGALSFSGSSSIHGEMILEEGAMIIFTADQHRFERNSTLMALGELIGEEASEIVVSQSVSFAQVTSMRLQAGQFITEKIFASNLQSLTLHGGNFIGRVAVNIEQLEIVGGVFTVDSKIEVQNLNMYTGKVTSSKRQNKLIVKNLLFEGGIFEGLQDKKLTVEADVLTVTGYVAKVNKSLFTSLLYTILSSEYDVIA